jgi:cytochrome P450
MSYRYAPGPKGYALLRVALRSNVDPLNVLLELAQDYGNIVHIGGPGYHLTVVNHPDLVYELLVEKSQLFGKPRSLTRPLLDFLGNGLLVSQGAYWLHQRRLMQPAFHHRRIEGYVENMVACAEAVMNRWRGGDVLEMQHEMMRLTLGMVTRTLFSADLMGLSSEITEAVEIIQHICYQQGQIPTVLPLVRNRHKSAAIGRLDAIVMKLIRQRRADGVDQGDLLSMLLLACREDGTPLTDAEVHDEVMTVLLAGHESTANALMWTWYLLSQNPEAEARLHEELQMVLGGRAPTLYDFEHLPYTKNVVKEALRLYPPAWALPRESQEDAEIGGYRIPRGSMAVAVPYVIHRDPRYYDAPEAFMPERFTPEFEEELPRFAYLPFGAGPRQCIGNTFALLAMQVTLATMCQSWRWRLAADQPVTLAPLLTLCSKYGMRMQAERVPEMTPVGELVDRF